MRVAESPMLEKSILLEDVEVRDPAGEGARAYAEFISGGAIGAGAAERTAIGLALGMIASCERREIDISGQAGLEDEGPAGSFFRHKVTMICTNMPECYSSWFSGAGLQ
jgi:hypothetical protein